MVWRGENPGIYMSWDACRNQVSNVSGALYRSFETREEAEKAFSGSPYEYFKKQNQTKSSSPILLKDVTSERTDSGLCLPREVPSEALAVDAACSGNPGMMEYRGVKLSTGETIFHFGPIYGTNNIGEFLAIVHALAMMDQIGLEVPIYSDSWNAIKWVAQKKCKTRLPRNEHSAQVYLLIDRAEQWLNTHTVNNLIRKWETKHWGEVPADFGRK